MLIQLHHQFNTGTTEICAQGDIETISEFQDFVKETQASHPLPAGAKWMACNERSKFFVKTEIIGGRN